MKRKLILFLTLCLTIVLGMAAFSACNGDDGFKLSFDVDGVIVKTIDTKGNETIEMPADPVKDGYDFDGWYWDKDVWTEPFTASSLLDRTLSEDLTVYAKFKLSHTHAYDKEVATAAYLKTAATCTESAVYYKSCECGEKGTETFTYGNALGHNFADYVSDNNATCTTDGTKTGHCTRCNASDTIADLNSRKQHTFDKEVATETYLKTAATCTESAVYYKSCECGEKGTETFTYGNPLGHNMEGGICTVCGYKYVSYMRITANPDKTVYKVGEALDLTGLIVSLVYSDESLEPITDYTTDLLNGYVFTDDDIHITDVNVVYGKFSVSFAITVNPAETILTYDQAVKETLKRRGVGAFIDYGKVNMTGYYYENTADHIPVNRVGGLIDYDYSALFLDNGSARSSIPLLCGQELLDQIYYYRDIEGFTVDSESYKIVDDNLIMEISMSKAEAEASMYVKYIYDDAGWAIYNKTDIVATVTDSESGVKTQFLSGNELFMDGYDAVTPASGAYITGIVISNYPVKTDYKVGEAFSTKGLAIKKVYSDGTCKLITWISSDTCTTSINSGYKFTEADLNVIMVTVTRGEFSTNFKISVKADGAELTREQAIEELVHREAAGASKSYNMVDYDCFDLRYGEFYSEKQSAEIKLSGSDYTVEVDNLNVNVGCYKISEIIQRMVNFSTIFDLEERYAIVGNYLSIETKMTAKAEYLSQVPFKTITGYYLVNAEGYVEVFCESDAPVEANGGYVKFAMAFKNYKVGTLPSKTIEEIRVVQFSDKTYYKVGETLDLTGLVVEAIYSDNTSKEITDYTLSVDADYVFTADDLGNFRIEIKRGELVDYIELYVSDDDEPNPGEQPKETKLTLAEAYDELVSREKQGSVENYIKVDFQVNISAFTKDGKGDRNEYYTYENFSLIEDGAMKSVEVSEIDNMRFSVFGLSSILESLVNSCDSSAFARMTTSTSDYIYLTFRSEQTDSETGATQSSCFKYIIDEFGYCINISVENTAESETEHSTVNYDIVLSNYSAFGGSVDPSDPSKPEEPEPTSITREEMLNELSAREENGANEKYTQAVCNVNVSENDSITYSASETTFDIVDGGGIFVITFGDESRTDSFPIFGLCEFLNSGIFNAEGVSVINESYSIDANGLLVINITFLMDIDGAEKQNSITLAIGADGYVVEGGSSVYIKSNSSTHYVEITIIDKNDNKETGPVSLSVEEGVSELFAREESGSSLKYTLAMFTWRLRHKGSNWTDFDSNVLNIVDDGKGLGVYAPLKSESRNFYVYDVSGIINNFKKNADYKNENEEYVLENGILYVNFCFSTTAFVDGQKWFWTYSFAIDENGYALHGTFEMKTTEKATGDILSQENTEYSCEKYE